MPESSMGQGETDCSKHLSIHVPSVYESGDILDAGLSFRFGSSAIQYSYGCRFI